MLLGERKKQKTKQRRDQCMQEEKQMTIQFAMVEPSGAMTHGVCLSVASDAATMATWS